MTDQELNNIILPLAENCVKDAKKIFEIDLSFDKDSLLKIDKIIKDHWGNGPFLNLESLVKPWGSFIAVCIKNIHGGTWGHDNDAGTYLDNVGGAGLKIFPFSKVRKRFENGEEDSITFYYECICNEIENSKST